MDFNPNLGACTPPQILNFSPAVNDISNIVIYDLCGCPYDISKIQFAYSLDNICWSCYMSYEEALRNTVDLKQDFYVRMKVPGGIGKVTINDEIYPNYTTELEGGFQFDSANNSENTYNPYANMDNAIALSQQLSESVSTLVGIPIYYIKLNPNAGSKDLTFKEYALMNVEAIKQIKLIIQDNTMPSSKPEFNDWGLDWQTDWETEITKGSFATAFGVTAQPMEGDLVYIPMMKRMWMVNAAYEEKRDGFMWVATTFKVALVKYEEKDSVQLGDAQSFVDSIVKNKYEDLFGEDDQSTYDSGQASTDAPTYVSYNKLYPVFESDATRGYVTCDSLDITQNSVYYKGTLISDSKYDFLRNDVESKISYQKKYCGDEIAISFLIYPQIAEYSGTILSIGNIKVNIDQTIYDCKLTLNKIKSISVNLIPNIWNFVTLKWSKQLNIVEMISYQYTHNQDIPRYKLSNNHFWFDIDTPIAQVHSKYDMELNVTERTPVEIKNFYGSITNFKLFDLYNDNISELLQMYPTHQHLMINDTARRIVSLYGSKT